MFVDDFLDLLVEVLPAFDQRVRPALPEAVQILFLSAKRFMNETIFEVSDSDSKQYTV